MSMRSFNNPTTRTLSLLTILAAADWLLHPAPITAQGQGQGGGGGGLQQRLDELEAELLLTQAALLELQETLAHVRMEEGELNGLAGPHLIIEGCNVHVRNATEFTDEIDGAGNLIVGYNERLLGGELRTGSHNLVVGRGHVYTSYGGFVAGEVNAATGEAATVSGGTFNVASGNWASVSGGSNNVASGLAASVSAGSDSEASGILSSISGGSDNHASGLAASVSGGIENVASANRASVTGGSMNTASGDRASVSGGFRNEASGSEASVSGGEFNVASHVFSTVSGGVVNVTAVPSDHVP